MATSPLFGWEEPDDVDLVKDGAAAIRTLGNAIDTSMGDLLGGTSGQVLSKNSNTNMDFTWVTPDDANAIQNAIVDAKGDLIAATAADTPARLAVGTNGQVLTADSTAATGIKWATPATASFIGVSLTNNASITLSNATDTKITWNTENYDTSGFHASSSSAVIIPAGLAGKYLITGTLCFDANTTGQRYILTRVNGTLVASNQDSAGSVAGVPKAWCFTNVVNLAVSDSIEFHAYQSSGGNLAVLFTAGYVTNVQITYLGA